MAENGLSTPLNLTNGVDTGDEGDDADLAKNGKTINYYHFGQK
jgi:hypothetical protein